MKRTVELLENEILPRCQYYAYIEVMDEHVESESILWAGYDSLLASYNHFARASVSDPADIYPVFHKLFASTRAR